MRKRFLLLALVIGACSNTQDLQKAQRQFAADIDAIGEAGQNGYFACRFVRHMWHCREAVWQQYPKPHAPAGNQREFLQRYIDEAERRGAANTLRAQGQTCQEVKTLESYFWQEGQQAICSDGTEYQIEQLEGSWRIIRIINGGK